MNSIAPTSLGSDIFFRRTTHAPAVINGTNGTSTTEGGEEHILNVILIFESAFVVLLNLFFITCIGLSRKSRKLKSVKFLLNLQLTHAFMGVTSIVLQEFDVFNELVVLFDALLLQMFLMLLCMTLERYLSVTWPMKFRNLATKYYVYTIALSWIFIIILLAIALSFTTRILQEHLVILSTALIAVSIITLLFTNINMFVIAQRHFKEIFKTSIASKKSKFRGNMKSTYTCLVIVVSFIVLWLPQLVHNILALNDNYYVSREKKFTRIVWLVALSDSLVNPFIYAIFNRELRQTIRKRVSFRHRRERNNTNSQTLETEALNRNVVN